MKQLKELGAYQIDTHKEVKIMVLPKSDERDFHLLYTDGLRAHAMTTPEDYDGPQFCELYFCLPYFWKWDEEHMQNINFNFPLEWIKRIMNVPIDRDTFIGPGHTFPAGTPPKPMCELTEQKAFILSLPKKAASILDGIKDEQENEITFLSIVPLYKQELDFKHLHGSVKFFERMNKMGFDEEVDVSRTPFRLKRFLFF